MGCSLLRKVKTYIGVSLPWYICAPVIMFALVFPIVFGCETYEDIGVMLDRCISFLAILTFSNVYHVELQLRTFEVYSLLPKGRKRADILKRIFVRFLFLTVIVLVCFAGYTLKGVHTYADQDTSVVCAQAFFSIVAVMLFFGAISFWTVNLTGSMAVGVGISIAVWMILVSALAAGLPALINVFAYGAAKDWYIGKITAIAAAVLFFIAGTVAIDNREK